MEPARLSFPDAWVGHIPFAFWLVENLTPDKLVELGTYSGNSYFSFCQGVSSNNLPTRCYAVDQWRGDEHAGFYDEDVFQAVSAYNAKHYGAFSQLLRMTFDEALAAFGNRTIDLLHLDGLHTYEAVKHDFEIWRPKVSARGVVLFHDIKMRERGFGVWQLWEELSRQFPCIEFDHAHGLGVLFIGAEQPPRIKELLKEWNRADGSRLIKLFFARLGRCVELQYQVNVASQIPSTQRP